jgi:hypothetical protein
MVNKAMDTAVRARLDAVARDVADDVGDERAIDYWRWVKKGTAMPSSTRWATRHPGR